MRRAAQLGQKPRTSTEGHHQAFRVTAVTAHLQESVLKTAAFQVILELPLDIPRQIRALCRQMGHESGLRYPSSDWCAKVY